VWATVAGSIEYHFFETSAVLLCFVLLGKYLQSLAVTRTSAALTKLLSLQPKTAIKIMSSSGGEINNNSSWNPLEEPYQEEVVPLTSIHSSDVVKVLKGASIPAGECIQF
jgi:Cu+-exporting ATPase